MRDALAAIGCDDIPKNGLWVIGGLANNAGNSHLPLGDLVRDLGVSKQAVGQLVDTLVLRGYLERSADPDDRRKLTVHLTGRGRVAAKAIRAARDEIDAALLARVGEKGVRAARLALVALMAVARTDEDSQDVA